jgi:hypothetical protein
VYPAGRGVGIHRSAPLLAVALPVVTLPLPAGVLLPGRGFGLLGLGLVGEQVESLVVGQN